MRYVLLFLLAFSWCLASENHVVDSASSNAYYKADTSLLLLGSDEIIGINRDIHGKVLSGFRQGKIYIRSGRFDSDNTTRDKHIREILQADTYPNIVFIIHGVEGIDHRSEGEATLHGQLKIFEQSRTLAIPIRWKRHPSNMILEGKTSIFYRDFGIEPPTLGGGLLKQAGEQIEIGARIVLVPEEGAY